MKESKTRRFNPNSPYKRIAKCLRYKNPAYTVRTMLGVPFLKRATVTEVVNVSGSQWWKHGFIVCMFMYQGVH